MNKKLISSLLTVAMAINIFAIMPLNAFAIGSESKVYEKDGYTVTYRIGSEWDNNRSVEVTIENTGDEQSLAALNDLDVVDCKAIIDCDGHNTSECTVCKSFTNLNFCN